jgi:hypothetical protein
MDFFETLEEVLADDGPLGETANRIAESVVDCLGGMADSIDGLVEKLGEIGEELADDADGEEPNWDETPGLRAIKEAADSLIGIVEGLSDNIDAAREQLEARYLKTGKDGTGI